ncbi:MAG TPA: aminoacyl-tRNA hydrolase [Patescibacteria group bacterium]|nr:aminoacyl-tRNA hydrolase [Patescibacteria group bacterium]
MKAIIGLGNPGRWYAASRHNVGFMAVAELARLYGISLKKDNSILALSGKGSIEGIDVVLAQPLTFMNLSGGAVKAVVRKYKVAPGELLVVCDDLDLEFGRLKIRPSGASGGHRGLASIIEALAHRDFCRLRIGIGRPQEDDEAADYVLSGFTKEQKRQLPEIIARSTQCCRAWMHEGISKSMNIFNRRSNAE